MHFGMKICGVAAIVCVVLVGCNLYAGEATPAQIQTWIKQLGNEDFQKREEARAALLKAGSAATAALKEAQKSEDTEVRNAASLLLSQLQWQAVPEQMDYMKLFPKETLFAAHLRDVEAFKKGSLNTALMKLRDNEDFKPLVDLLTERAKKQMGPALPMLQKWTDHFSGQIAGAVWAFNPMQPKAMRMALVAELKADALDKVFKEFLAETGMLRGAVPTPINGLTILNGANDRGAMALVGKHVVLGPNLESVRIVAENMLEPPADGMAANPDFGKALSSVGSPTDFLFAMDFQRYLKFLGKMGPEGPKMEKMMSELGYGGMGFFLLTTRIVGDRFEDRFIMTLNGKPSKLMDLMTKFYDADVDLKKAFAPVPANAVIAGNSHMDGTAMYNFGLDWVKQMVQLEGDAKPEEIDKGIAEFEKLTGVKLTDVTGAIKGDMAYWVELAPALAPPQVGFYVQCVDATKAKDLAGYVSQYIEVAAKMTPPPEEPDDLQAVPAPGEEADPKAEPKQDEGKEDKPPVPAIQKREYKGHTIYTESPESPLVAIPDRELLPYRLTWAVHKDRVFFTSSVVQMQKRLVALDAGTPGLDPMKALPANVADASSVKGMMIVDIPQALDYGAKFGLPLLGAVAGKDKQIQAELTRLAQLAGDRSLFKGVPPLVAAAGPPGKDNIQSTIIWTPTPYMPTVMLGVGGAVFFARGKAAERPRGGGAVPPPAPPPDVNF